MTDDSETSPVAAEMALAVSRRFPFERKPGVKCDECACDPGWMYEGIAIAVARHLGPRERGEVLKSWDCHKGGRCMGAGEAVARELKRLRGRP